MILPLKFVLRNYKLMEGRLNLEISPWVSPVTNWISKITTLNSGILWQGRVVDGGETQFPSRTSVTETVR